MKRLHYVVLSFVLLPFLYAEWEPAFQLTDNGSAMVAKSWSISASFGGIVHVTWVDTSAGSTQIFYKRSQDHGITWEAGRCLTKTPGHPENPSVSIAGVMNPVTHIIWDDDRDSNKEIYYKRSSDWGITWSADKRLTNAPASSVDPTVHGCICCGADVRIVWMDKRNGNADIYYKYSTDNGIIWSDDIQLTDDPSVQLHPSIAFCRELVQVVWIDFRNGYAETWGRRSTDCGATWETETCLSSEKPYDLAYPTIAHVDSTFHLFWIASSEKKGDANAAVFYKRTTDLGMTWEPDVRLTGCAIMDSSLSISCAVLGSAVCLAWVDQQNAIYYKHSTDNGTTWAQDSCLAFKPDSEIKNPSLAMAAQCVHLVWVDRSEGGASIIYTRNPGINPEFSK